MPAKKVNSLNLATFSAFLIKSAQLAAALNRGKPGPQGPSPFGPGIFKYVKKRKHGRRAPVVITPGGGSPPAGPVVVNPAPTPTGQGGTVPSVVRTLLWKKSALRATDAQIASQPKSQTKGCLTLASAHFRDSSGSRVHSATYFRHNLFARRVWTPGTPEKATASFRVWILGSDRGVHSLKLSHDLKRVSNQRNVPTWLHWSRNLNAYLKLHSVVGKTLRLYSALPSDGADFFLEIV